MIRHAFNSDQPSFYNGILTSLSILNPFNFYKSNLLNHALQRHDAMHASLVWPRPSLFKFNSNFDRRVCSPYVAITYCNGRQSTTKKLSVTTSQLYSGGAGADPWAQVLLAINAPITCSWMGDTSRFLAHSRVISIKAQNDIFPCYLRKVWLWSNSHQKSSLSSLTSWQPSDGANVLTVITNIV